MQAGCIRAAWLWPRVITFNLVCKNMAFLHGKNGGQDDEVIYQAHHAEYINENKIYMYTYEWQWSDSCNSRAQFVILIPQEWWAHHSGTAKGVPLTEWNQYVLLFIPCVFSPLNPFFYVLRVSVDQDGWPMRKLTRNSRTKYCRKKWILTMKILLPMQTSILKYFIAL